MLQLGIVRWIFSTPGFLLGIQCLLLGGFGVFIALGWGVFPPADASAKLFARSNLVTLTIWGLWWPLMIWCAVLLGRVWCAVCPLELVANISERIGRAIGIKQRTLSRWLAGGTITVALYALLQLLVAAAQLHRTPGYTAWFLVGLLSLAALTGLAFKNRGFCRGFCPVGLLLSTYGRGGVLAIRPKTRGECGGCAGRSCSRESRRSEWDARSCPSLLNPAKLVSSVDCLVCGQCLKSCDRGNMRLWLRPLFSREDRRVGAATWPVTVFVMMAFGFVLWELCTESPRGLAIFLAAPSWAAKQLEASQALKGFLNWAWALVIVPSVLAFSLASLARLLGHGRHVGDLLRTYALPLAVVVAAGHMAKALAKFNTWAPFLPGAIDKPDGIETMRAIMTGAAAAPVALVGHEIGRAHV